MEDYQLFNKDTKAIIYGFQQRAIQRMLDFDFVCRRETPSVAAVIRPTQTMAIAYHKLSCLHEGVTQGNICICRYISLLWLS